MDIQRTYLDYEGSLAHWQTASVLGDQTLAIADPNDSEDNTEIDMR